MEGNIRRRWEKERRGKKREREREKGRGIGRQAGRKRKESKKSMGSRWGSNPGPPAQPQQPVIASRPQSGSWLAEENRPY